MTEPFGSISCLDIRLSDGYFKIEPNGSVKKFDRGSAMRKAIAGSARIDEPAAQASERGPGQDPQKRRQIIDGARRLFFTQGFDAASMGDTAQEAGVSKGTLYVYFESKERLFGEVVSEERAKFQALHFVFDPDDHDVPAVLGRVGRGLVRVVTTAH